VTSYELDNWGVGVRDLVGSRIFPSPNRPDWLWGPPNLLTNRYRDFFRSGKAARAWSWPLTSSWCEGQENVDLYIHTSICLHGIVLNSLSAGAILLFFFFLQLYLIWETFIECSLSLFHNQKWEMKMSNFSMCMTTWHPLSAKVGTSFADRRRSLDRYSSLADSKPRSFYHLVSQVVQLLHFLGCLEE
jgi:hypothetical protein